MHEEHSLSLIQAASIFPLLEFISSQSIFQHAFQLHFWFKRWFMLIASQIPLNVCMYVFYVWLEQHTNQYVRRPHPILYIFCILTICSHVRSPNTYTDNELNGRISRITTTTTTTMTIAKTTTKTTSTTIITKTVPKTATITAALKQ